MQETFEQIYETAKHGIFKTFLRNYAGFLTDEELERNLSNLYSEALRDVEGQYELSKEARADMKKDVDALFRMGDYQGTFVPALKVYFEENTNPHTKQAMIHYYCSGEFRDRDKAKELFLKAYEEGDYFAGCFAKEKSWTVAQTTVIDGAV